MGLFPHTFGFLLTWWGAYVLGALDASMVFFLPFGIDALVIYLSSPRRALAPTTLSSPPFGIDALVISLSARNGMLFWIYPLLATAGSVTGAAVTYWIRHKGGGAGPRRMDRGGAP